MSITIPMMSRKMLTRVRMTYLLLESESSQPAIACGTCMEVMIQAKAVEVAISRKTMETVLTESLRILPNRLMGMSR